MSIRITYFRKQIGLIILLFLLFAVSNTSMAQRYFSEEQNECFRAIYGFSLLEADSISKRNNLEDPTSASWNIMVANTAWAQILAGNLDSEEWNTQFADYLKTARGILKDSDLNEDENLFNFIILHAFKTRHELLNDNYLLAANNLNTCIDQISSSFGRETEYAPFYLTSGLYHYFMHRAHEEYIMLRPYLLMYPKGDKELGLSYLYKLSTSDDVFLKTESNYFLLRIYFDLEEDFERASMHARYLLKSFPNNIIYQYYLIECLRKLDSPELASAKRTYFKLVDENDDLSIEQKDHFRDLLPSDEGTGRRGD